MFVYVCHLEIQESPRNVHTHTHTQNTHTHSHNMHAHTHNRGDSSITSDDSSDLTGLHRPGGVEPEPPFLCTLCLIAFAFANIAQHISHRQLAGLRPPSSRAAQSVSGKLGTVY